MPDRFIALAERTGMIMEIGRWVLDEACRQMQTWRRAGTGVPGIAVNLSAAQFQSPDLFALVRPPGPRHVIGCGDQPSLKTVVSASDSTV